MGHGFRFALQSAPQDQQQWVAVARRAEQLGYSGLLMPDGLQLPSPIPALALAAGTTTSLHVGTYVLASPLRAPRMAAWEAHSLSLLSGGRFQLGIGRGRPEVAQQAVELLGQPVTSPGPAARAGRPGGIRPPDAPGGPRRSCRRTDRRRPRPHRAGTTSPRHGPGRSRGRPPAHRPRPGLLGEGAEQGPVEWLVREFVAETVGVHAGNGVIAAAGHLVPPGYFHAPQRVTDRDADKDAVRGADKDAGRKRLDRAGASPGSGGRPGPRGLGPAGHQPRLRRRHLYRRFTSRLPLGAAPARLRPCPHASAGCAGRWPAPTVRSFRPAE